MSNRTWLMRNYYTQRKLQKRRRLLKEHGERCGMCYRLQRAKVEKSLHYMHKGHISHFVQVGFRKHTKQVGYGAKYHYSAHDLRQLLKGDIAYDGYSISD